MFGNKRHCLPPIITEILIILLAGFFTPSIASEGGGGAYSNGADDFNAGRLLPPGTYFFNYFNYHYADMLKDNSGHTIPVNFSYEVTGNGFRLFHVTKAKVLGSHKGMYVILPVAHIQVTYLNKSQSKTGLADMTINPFVLGWHFTQKTMQPIIFQVRSFTLTIHLGKR